jgi:hypothetical protein
MDFDHHFSFIESSIWEIDSVIFLENLIWMDPSVSEP